MQPNDIAWLIIGGLIITFIIAFILDYRETPKYHHPNDKNLKDLAKDIKKISWVKVFMYFWVFILVSPVILLLLRACPG